MALAAYEKWQIAGLQAVRSAGQQGAELSTKTSAQSKNPELKALAQEVAETHTRHSETLAGYLKEAGEDADKAHDMIMDGVIKGAALMLEAATDDDTREVALISGEERGLQYFVPAYASLAQVAETLGKTEQAKAYQSQSEECEGLSKRYRKLAQKADKKAAQPADKQAA